MNKTEEKCCMYIDLIDAMGRDSLLEPKRSELHSEICDLLEIPHNATKHITGDLTGVAGRQLYTLLIKLREDLKTKSKKEILFEELMEFRRIWGERERYTKAASIVIYNKLITMQLTAPEELQVSLEAYKMEAEMRHKAVFDSDIIHDVFLAGLGGAVNG